MRSQEGLEARWSKIKDASDGLPSGMRIAVGRAAGDRPIESAIVRPGEPVSQCTAAL